MAACQLIYPLFVKEGIRKPEPVASMPGVMQFPLGEIATEAKDCFARGIRQILLFGVPAKKDEGASGAYAADGIVQRAIPLIKKNVPGMTVMTDVCLCEYMSHGHCGVVSRDSATGKVVRDDEKSLLLLVKTALSHAKAGADWVAPSDMIPGRVGAIRKALDAGGFRKIPIMSYAIKYASSFYGPFRDAAESAPAFGDRSTYQLDPANVEEALRRARLDEEEGAAVLMVKPAGPYLDMIARLSGQTRMPVAAYQVSGEYAMIKAAGEKGWIDEKEVVLESLQAIRRAGASLIITYFTKELACSTL